jgi:hypothetical protein
MDEPIVIPVIFQDTELEFTATLQTWSYGFRFIVDIEGMEVIFEKDDEGEYRALIAPGQLTKSPKVELIAAIGQVLARK